MNSDECEEGKAGVDPKMGQEGTVREQGEQLYQTPNHVRNRHGHKSENKF